MSRHDQYFLILAVGEISKLVYRVCVGAVRLFNAMTVVRLSPETRL